MLESRALRFHLPSWLISESRLYRVLLTPQGTTLSLTFARKGKTSMLNVSKFKWLACCVFFAAASILASPADMAAQATASQGTAAQLQERINQLEQELAKI